MIRAAGRSVLPGRGAGPLGVVVCAPFGGVPGLCQPVGVRAWGGGEAAGPGLSPGRAVVELPVCGEGLRPAAWPLSPSGVR